MYTIGQPRVGNKEFREQLELSSPDTIFFRITNNQDCVPSLARGQHCGTHVHFDAEGHLSFVCIILIHYFILLMKILASTNLEKNYSSSRIYWK